MLTFKIKLRDSFFFGSKMGYGSPRFMTGANLNVLFDATWTTHEIRVEGAHGFGFCKKKRENKFKIDDTDGV